MSYRSGRGSEGFGIVERDASRATSEAGERRRRCQPRRRRIVTPARLSSLQTVSPSTWKTAATAASDAPVLHLADGLPNVSVDHLPSGSETRHAAPFKVVGDRTSMDAELDCDIGK